MNAADAGNGGEMAKIIWLISFLGVNSIQDIRCRRVWLPSFPLFLAAGIYLGIGQGRGASQLAAFLPGLFLLAAGKVTKGAIGIGDGLTVLMLGVCCSPGEVCEIVLAALMLGAGWAMILLIIKKKGYRQEFSWIPCLFLACVIRMVTV